MSCNVSHKTLLTGLNLDLLKMDTYKMDMEKDPLFRGEFDVVKQLIDERPEMVAAKKRVSRLHSSFSLHPFYTIPFIWSYFGKKFIWSFFPCIPFIPFHSSGPFLRAHSTGTFIRFLWVMNIGRQISWLTFVALQRLAELVLSSSGKNLNCTQDFGSHHSCNNPHLLLEKTLPSQN